MKELISDCINIEIYPDYGSKPTDDSYYDCVEYTFAPCELCPNGIEMNIDIGQGGDLNVNVTLKLELCDVTYENNYRGMFIRSYVTKHGLNLKKVHNRIKANRIKFIAETRTMYLLTWDSDENPESCFGIGSGTKDDPDMLELYA